MKNVTREQMAALRRLCLADKRMRVRWCERRGVAGVIEGRLANPEEISGQRQLTSETPDKIFQTLMELFGILVGPPNILGKHRRIGKEYFDRERNTLRMRAGQVSKSLEGIDLPVYDTALLILFDCETGFYRIQSSFWRTVHVDRRISVNENTLKALLARNLDRAADIAGQFKQVLFEGVLGEGEKEQYPLIASPALYLYPQSGGFHPAYYALAYQPVRRKDSSGKSKTAVEQVRVVVDAATGKRVWQLPTRSGLNEMRQVSIHLPGSSGSEPLQGLQVAEDDSGRRWMINDKKEGFRIEMYDAKGKNALTDYLIFLKKAKKDPQVCQVVPSLPDAGNTHVRRQESNAPELSGYLKAEEAWNYYKNFGWLGFDNGGQVAADGSSLPPCPVQVVVHTGIGLGENVTGFDYYYDKPGWAHGFIYFGDGLEDEQGNLRLDFDACDPSVFAHEYQHAITSFGTGTETRLLASWIYAINEGLSDAFACLRTGKWVFPLFSPEGIIHRGSPFRLAGRKANCMPYRRMEYPRSTETFWGDWYCDHNDDSAEPLQIRGLGKVQLDYFRSTMFSHLAFLVGQGGIHQRAGRSPELIPVSGLGLEKAAWIFHHFATSHFELITGKDERKENDYDWKTFVDAAQKLLKAAQESGKSTRSSHYVLMRRALYALGLYPYDDNYKKKHYGGEACMLPWTWEWRFSRPYLGFPDLLWQSPDLIVSGDGLSACNPQSGKENLLFARIRNIGDQNLSNILVRFYYHSLCTTLHEEINGWKACKTKTGQDCILRIENLPAGSMTFEDLRDASPDQSIRWYLNPEDQIDGVSHFSLRAVIEFDEPKPPNHKNKHPYQVQSSVIILDPAEGAEQSFSFLAYCPTSEDSRAEAQTSNQPQNRLEVKSTLPEGYRIETEPAQENNRISLKPGETRVTCRMKMPETGIDRLKQPFEGRVTSSFKSTFKGKKAEGEFIGELCIEPYFDITSVETSMESGAGLNVTLADTEACQSRKNRNVKLTRMLSGKIKAVIDGEKVSGSTQGSFTGTLELRTGELIGKYQCNIQFSDGMFKNEYRRNRAVMNLKGTLQPLRAIHFSQFIGDDAVGGVTVIVKEPAPEASAGRSTTTRFNQS